jgi:hypothetical protein
MISPNGSTLANIPVNASAYIIKRGNKQRLEGNFSISGSGIKELYEFYKKKFMIVYEGGLIEEGKRYDVSVDVFLFSFSRNSSGVNSKFALATDGKIHYKNPLVENCTA